jgi:hypothetical protein
MTHRVANRVLAAALALAAAAPGGAEPSPCGNPCCRREAHEAPAIERAGCCAVEAAPERAGPAPGAEVAPAPAPALPAVAVRPGPAPALADGGALLPGAPRATGPPLHLRLRSLLC